ncbi:uncharacterized protein LOC143232655 isoform X2 [Tachypleus tridentatus]|uniref:uncharacterized protein LOC143232655 isoform X2 n=1 Tax=Tachypleus tridentatus TaxID=6853 RepID=UPI003FD10753
MSYLPCKPRRQALKSRIPACLSKEEQASFRPAHKDPATDSTEKSLQTKASKASPTTSSARRETLSLHTPGPKKTGTNPVMKRETPNGQTHKTRHPKPNEQQPCGGSAIGQVSQGDKKRPDQFR